MSGNRHRGTGLPRVGTAAHKQRIGERDNWVCGICGQPITPTQSVFESDWAAVVDHIHPRCAGGTHEDDNLQIAHAVCNNRKSSNVGDQTYAEWRAHQRLQAIRPRVSSTVVPSLKTLSRSARAARAPSSPLSPRRLRAERNASALAALPQW